MSNYNDTPDFNRALAFTLLQEGGYSNNPADPGGMTMYGIIQREYDAYRKSVGLPKQWVKLISTDEVHTIYRNKYWNVVTQGRIKPLNIVMFDIAVNSGPANAEWMLAQAKRQHPEYANQPEPERQYNLALAVCAVRRQFYYNIVAHRPASKVFLNGWLSRDAQLVVICQRLHAHPLGLLGVIDAPETLSLPDEASEGVLRTDDVDAAALHDAYTEANPAPASSDSPQ